MAKLNYSQPVEAERGYLVGVKLQRSRALLSVDDSLRELTLLAETAGNQRCWADLSATAEDQVKDLDWLGQAGGSPG